jgi:hypothetical protein
LYDLAFQYFDGDSPPSRLSDFDRHYSLEIGEVIQLSWWVVETVKDLVSRGQIEVRDAPDRNWDTGRPLTGEGLDDALADPAALVYTAEGVRPIILRLVSKDH